MIKKILRVFLGVLFVLFVIEIIVIAPESIDEKDQADAEFSVSEPPEWQEGRHVEQDMKGPHLVMTREGGREWELWADQALSYKDDQAWSLKKVKAIFFGEGDVTFTVTGKEGLVNVESKNMTVSGDVVVESSNGYSFFSAEVIYDSEMRRLISPGLVRMVNNQGSEQGQKLSLVGEDMEADLENSDIRVMNNVKTKKFFEDNKRLDIESNSAFFSARSRKAKFVGDVILDYETMRITGPTAEFQYDSEEDFVRSVYVDGGVRVSDVDKWATSQNVSVDFIKDRYVFTGSPRLVQDSDELRGEKIVFLKGGKQVQVRGAKAIVDKDKLEKVN